MEESTRMGADELDLIRREQEAWAHKKGLLVCPNSYLERYGVNIFLPISDSVLKAFNEGAGAELQDKSGHPGKMSSLISSSALAYNFFAPFDVNRADALHLARAMKLSEPILDLKFEFQCPTGLRGKPPHLDVCLFLEGRVIGLESKFTEWLLPKAAKLSDFNGKYLKPNTEIWASAGLPLCQSLAEAIGARRAEFKHLDALQLLKHGLGLRKCFGQRAALAYVFMNRRGPVGEAHAAEVQAFTSAIAPELDFRVWTYHELMAAVRATGPSMELLQRLDEFAERYLN